MPQLKKPITSIEHMVCEHCIHFQLTPKCGEPYCINPDSDDWDRIKDETCSKGTWLYYGKWIDSEETKEQLHTMSYSELYLRFAELNELPRNPRQLEDRE